MLAAFNQRQPNTHNKPVQLVHSRRAARVLQRVQDEGRRRRRRWRRCQWRPKGGSQRWARVDRRHVHPQRGWVQAKRSLLLLQATTTRRRCSRATRRTKRRQGRLLGHDVDRHFEPLRPARHDVGWQHRRRDVGWQRRRIRLDGKHKLSDELGVGVDGDGQGGNVAAVGKGVCTWKNTPSTIPSTHLSFLPLHTSFLSTTSHSTCRSAQQSGAPLRPRCCTVAGQPPDAAQRRGPHRP